MDEEGLHIVQIMPAEAGWRAYYATRTDRFNVEIRIEPVVAWALVTWMVVPGGQQEEEIQPVVRGVTGDTITITERAAEDDPVYLAPPGEPEDEARRHAERRFLDQELVEPEGVA